MFGSQLGWYTIHTLSGALAPNRILSGAKFTLYPSLAFSCFLAALLHSTGALGFAAWYKEWNYGTFAPHHFQQRAPPSEGGHHILVLDGDRAPPPKGA